MKKWTVLLFFMLNFLSVTLYCSPLTAYILVQRYEQLKKENKPPFQSVKNTKLEKFDLQTKDINNHYAALDNAMQKSIDLNL